MKLKADERQRSSCSVGLIKASDNDTDDDVSQFKTTFKDVLCITQTNMFNGRCPGQVECLKCPEPLFPHTDVTNELYFSDSLPETFVLPSHDCGGTEDCEIMDPNCLVDHLSCWALNTNS